MEPDERPSEKDKMFKLWFNQAHEKTKLISFQTRCDAIITLPLVHLYIRVYPGEYEEVYLHEQNKANGELVFFEAELRQSLGRQNTHTRLLTLNADGDETVQWFIDIFRSLESLDLKSNNFTVSKLMQFTGLKSLTLNVARQDLFGGLFVSHFPLLEKFNLFYQIPPEIQDIDIEVLKHFFFRHQRIWALTLYFYDGQDPDESHRKGIMKGAWESLKELRDLEIESRVGNFANFLDVRAMMERYARTYASLKFSADGVETVMIKQPDGRVGMVQTRRPAAAAAAAAPP